MHTADALQEWGATLELRLKPRDEGGRGLSLAVGPEWGPQMDRVLEREEIFGQSGPAALQPQQIRRTALGGSVSYGLDAFGGLLTPYIEYSLVDGDLPSDQLTNGLRFRSRSGLELRLFSEQQTYQSGSPTRRTRLELQRMMF